MTTASLARRPVWTGPRAAAGIAGWVAACALLGLVAGSYPLFALAALLAAAAFAVGIANWRHSVVGLLAFLPFSGIPAIALHPRVGEAALVKDFLFVAPAYAGFVWHRLRNGQPLAFRGAPLGLLGLLAVVVVVQAANPSLPSPLVALVGLKVWLFYVPLLFLGYFLVEDRLQLERLLRFMTLVALVAALFGIVQAALVYLGRPDLAYRVYGGAAETATQGFAVLDVGSDLRRIPSTLSSGTQFYAFLISMIAVSYAYWRGTGTRRGRSLRGATVAIMVLAAFLCGARGAFLFVPLLLVLIVLLESGGPRRLLRVGVGAIAALFGAGALIGTSGFELLRAAWANGVFQLDFVLFRGMSLAWDNAPFGLGTGIDTGAARYVGPPHEIYAAFGGAWQESWWVKAILELGFLGLVIALVLFGTLVARAVRTHVRLRDARLRSISAALLALVIWMLIYNLKAQYVDLDPMNVYLWLFLGLLARIAVLGRESPVLGRDHHAEHGAGKRLERLGGAAQGSTPRPSQA